MFRFTGRILAAVIAVLATCTAACSGVTAAAAAGHGAGIAGAEQFQIVTTTAASLNTGGTSSLVASGAFGGGGVAVTVRYGNSWTVTFKLAGGSFRLAESAGTGTQTLDKATCVLTQHWHGTYVLSHGTGTYAGISGHGTYHLDWFVAAPHKLGTCDRTAKPIAFQLITRTSGHVSV